MAFAWMAAGATLFSLMTFFARIASEHIPWMLVASVRAFVGAGVAIAVARVRGAPMVVRNKKGIWWRSAWGTISILATFYAVGSPALPLADSVTLLNLAPVFIAGLAPLLLGERAGRRVAIALPLSLLGTVFILRPAFLFSGHTTLTGASLFIAAVCLLGAMTTCFAMIMLRQLGASDGPEAIAIHFSMTAAVVIGLLAIPSFTVPTLRDGAWMLAAGLSAGLGQLCMTRAYALERAARVSGIGYLSVVVSALLGAIGLHERPSLLALSGMALVVSGGLVVTIAGVRDGGPREVAR